MAPGGRREKGPLLATGNEVRDRADRLADILGQLGDAAGRIEALREEVRGYEGLPVGQRSEDKLRDAKRRLTEAEAR